MLRCLYRHGAAAFDSLPPSPIPQDGQSLDLTLQLLSYVAQLERESIGQRQAEGIAAARARGVRFGRPRLERPAEYEQALARYRGGEMSDSEAARLCGVSRSTFRRWASEGLEAAVEHTG